MQILAWHVETAGGPIVIVNHADYKVVCCQFRPGATPRVTFSAVHHVNGGFEAGLYQIPLTTDPTTGAITGADATAITRIIEGSVFTYTSRTGVTYFWSQVMNHDWLNETKLVYGDDTWSSDGGAWSQLYLYDFAYPGVPRLALIAANQPRMIWGPAVSPDGTRVTYGNYTALYEVTTGGNATPTVWVSSTRSRQATGFDYLDDSYLVYGWRTTSYPPVSDVYRKLRGSSAANLTGDVSASCVPVAAR